MNEKRKVRVLLVDDEMHIRELMKVALKDMNAEVVAEADNGKEALELFRQHKPEITIMDVNMPVMNGLETLKAIKSEFPDAFVIMLTAVSSIKAVQEILELGASGYIRKDTSLPEIKQGIKETWAEYMKEKKQGKKNA
ncbi:MAG: response regulator transcription factor [Nitrospinota bacterium]